MSAGTANGALQGGEAPLSLQLPPVPLCLLPSLHSTLLSLAGFAAVTLASDCSHLRSYLSEDTVEELLEDAYLKRKLYPLK